MTTMNKNQTKSKAGRSRRRAATYAAKPIIATMKILDPPEPIRRYPKAKYSK